MRARGDRGITLIELAVVAAIVLFLVCALASVCACVKHTSKAESTRSLVRILDAACEAYRAKMGTYPGSPSAVADTTVLHRALCVPLPATKRGAGDAGPVRMMEAFVELPESRLTCAPQIHDDFGWPVRYSLPGANHAPVGRDNSRKFDLNASSPEAGAIGNWNP